jgi:hypothetical protein
MSSPVDDHMTPTTIDDINVVKEGFWLNKYVYIGSYLVYGCR